ncbi:hypothetical protein ACP4OV_007051 [Aristida adscensionis]
MEVLPEDVLADVLGRLAPRCLAVARRVCTAWRAAVDGRRLLRADLLPLAVGGIFINTDNSWMTWLLSRPTAGPAVSADLSYAAVEAMSTDPYFIGSPFKVRDHCNGLLLLPDCVLNPATTQRARLPPPPPPPPPCAPEDYFYTDEYIAYDPAASPHYEVVSVPRVRVRVYRGDEARELVPGLEGSEWPPASCAMHVWSSRTRRWEARCFVREGQPAGTIADMRVDTRVGTRTEHREAAYWRGALYVLCQADFVMRLSLSSDTYQVIQPPVPEFELYDDCMYDEILGGRRLSIGKSKNGVYSILVDQSHIRLWILDETDGQIKWEPKPFYWPPPSVTTPLHSLESDAPWMLQPILSYGDSFDSDIAEAMAPEKFEWDSDVDNVLEPEKWGFRWFITFLGFHPFKEVIFLNDSTQRVLAYHMNGFKIQYLGDVLPRDAGRYINDDVCVQSSFPYTPCWMVDLSENE